MVVVGKQHPLEQQPFPVECEWEHVPSDAVSNDMKEPVFWMLDVLGNGNFDGTRACASGG